jgi:hypothetical protein
VSAVYILNVSTTAKRHILKRKNDSNRKTNFVPLTKEDESENRTGKGKLTLIK